MTLSYRRKRFTRIKECNSRRMEQCRRSGKVNVICNANPVEFRVRSVIEDVRE